VSLTADPRTVVNAVLMQCIESNLGISTADGENVRLQYEDDKLSIVFDDWRDRLCTVVFHGVLAFRWQEFDENGICDDATYEVVGSPWLERQTKLHGVNAADYVHHKLCFNACGMLDVLARSVDHGHGV
jgi:hypothetical protein